MTRPHVATLDPDVARALTDQLGQPHFAVNYPIRLTAQNPYVSGRAALVFVHPHVVSPADDIAACGEFLLVESEAGIDYKPPHQDARVVAWFRPPEVERTYNIDFSIIGSPGSYSLESSDGTETTQIPGLLDWDKDLSTTFHSHSSGWLSFTLRAQTSGS
jgi:hypothetical protein